MDDPLVEEIAEANAFKPDLAVDIHNNAGGGDGFEAYHQTNGYKAKSLTLAKAIEAEVIKIGQNSRGVRTRLNGSGTDYYGFVHQVNAPAILIECAFIDSTDRTIIDEPHEQQAMGVAVAKGILATLGIAWQPLAPDKLYRVQVGAFASQDNAKRLAEELKAKGYQAILV